MQGSASGSNAVTTQRENIGPSKKEIKVVNMLKLLGCLLLGYETLRFFIADQ
jgi:hypothetical protein